MDTLVEDVLVIENSAGDVELEETLPFRYSITSYGADYPVDGLVKRIGEGNIIIPEFQRGFVWTYSQASRFVESLLLGLPVPGIFLSRDNETQKLLVIDGQQRLKSLLYFYRGVFADSGREFRLRGVSPQFEDVTYESLEEADRRRLDDSIIHATIVKQDEPSEDNSSVFLIFERLNTGGVQLQAQEIRSATFQGEFNDLLKELNENMAWRQLFGPVHRRMRDQELILRFFALYYNVGEYSKPMKEFLNKFMGSHRHLSFSQATEYARIFDMTCHAILENIGDRALKPRGALNAAVFDAVMVGVARRLEGTILRDVTDLRAKYEQLLEDARFLTVVETSTSDEENVRKRIELAIEAFRA